MNTKCIDIKNVIHSNYCIDMEDGDKVYAIIKEVLEKDDEALLSFEGIEIVITAFLNSAIGKLYADYNKEQIGKRVKAINLHKDFVPLWNKVMKGAPHYYANKATVEHHLQKEMED